MAVMRAPQELLDLQYSFTQIPLLMPDAFLREAAERGLRASRDDLQALHRLGLLVPIFRVRRDGRAVASAARRHGVWGRQAGRSEPTSRSDLLEARDRGALFDPSRERFVGRHRWIREAYGVQYQASEYVYSHHQLLPVSMLRQLIPFLSHREPDGQGARLHRKAYWDLLLRPRIAVIAALVVPLSALDPIYYPDIIGTFAGDLEEWHRHDEWRSEHAAQTVVQWLGVDAEWLKRHGQQLLHIADSIDPLGGWHQLVREAKPSTWKQLRGDARAAVDLRLAAEILLSAYDELVDTGQASPLPQRTGRERTPFDTRLKPRGHLDPLLTEFGLSPQPRLVLVVEGATELLIFPKLMEHFGIRTDREFIAIEDREGVRKDIAPLVAYAIAPPIELEQGGRYLSPLRPLTRLLVINDPEGPMATVEHREKRRQVWIERVMRTFPREHRTATVREGLDPLIHVDTWTRTGESFEYAHFTDLELAKAIAAFDERPRQPGLAERRSHIAKLRARRANIDKALEPWGNKVDLAEALWPVLLAKIARAEKHGTVGRIPIVRVLDRATDLANEFPRGNIVIPLQSESRDT